MKKILAFSIILSTSILSRAQTPELVKDINTSLFDTDVSGIIVLGSNLLMAMDQGAGVELFISDGTSSGTSLLVDVNPYGNADILFLETIGSTTYFYANDGINGYELWKTDGTSGGTMLVKDINPGPGNSNIQNTAEHNGLLFFSATNGTSGLEVWRSDGTGPGTLMVNDLFPGSTGSNPKFVGTLGANLLFTANTATTGNEIYKYDGAIVSLVSDINPGTTGSSSTKFTYMGGNFYFFANNGTVGSELWKTDGTDPGTVLVLDINPGPASSNTGASLITADGINIFFGANNGVNGGELWKSDGTGPGTGMLLDINPGFTGSNPEYLYYSGGALYFKATTTAEGQELWKSDGSAGGTVLVKDIYPGSFSSNVNLIGPFESGFLNVGGNIYFKASNGTDGTELWKSDGTSIGTVMVDDINPGSGGSNPGNAVIFNGNLYSGFTEAGGVENIYKINATTFSTTSLDCNLNTEGSSPSSIVMMGVNLLFKANNGVSGQELYISDGTTSGTNLMVDINPGATSSNPSELTVSGSTLYFTADDGTNGKELWKSDGTAPGTVLVTNIATGGTGSNPSSLTMLGSAVLFSANDGISNGEQLWKSDGTAPGTFSLTPLLDFDALSGSELRTVGSTVFFTATTTAEGTELWKTDGTAVGTILVSDLLPGASGSNPQNLTASGSTLYFTADNGVNGRELWKSDGTAGGTMMVADINPGLPDGAPIQLTPNGTTLFFSAEDGVSGFEIWKSDGTSVGTMMVSDIQPGSSSSNPGGLVSFGAGVIFAADNGTDGTEIWKTDGTGGGTMLVADINSGGSSFPSNMMAASGFVFFSADDGSTGAELWKTDGTISGTSMVSDIEPLTAEFSNPGNFTLLNDFLFMNAATLEYGNSELFKLALAGITVFSVPASMCAGSDYYIDFNVIGTITSGNVYTAQISDASGNFGSATDIGTLTSVSISDSILISIPSGISPGSNYRIRVNSSLTAMTGTDNGTDISINSPPLVSATTFPNDTICLGATITLSGADASTYIWTGSVTDNVPFTPVATGSASYIVTGTDASGCTDTAEVDIFVHPLPVVTGTSLPNDSVCAGNQVSLNGGGASTYSWSGGITNGSLFTPTATDTFFVTGTDANSCQATDSVIVFHFLNPIVSAGVFPNDTICEGIQLTLTGSGASNYIWTGGATNGLAFPATLTTDAYTVTGTDANGCTDSDTIRLYIKPAPTIAVSASPNDSICEGEEVALFSAGASGLAWTGGVFEGLPFSPSTTATYTVTGTGTNACQGQNSIAVVVLNCSGLEEEAEIQLSVFPNPSSGLITVLAPENVILQAFFVFSMDGRMVLKSNETNQSEKNKFDLSILTNGVYVSEMHTSKGKFFARIIIQH